MRLDHLTTLRVLLFVRRVSTVTNGICEPLTSPRNLLPNTKTVRWQDEQDPCRNTKTHASVFKCRAFFAQRRGRRKPKKERKSGGRDGELKTDWTKPLLESRPMGIE